MRRFALLMLCAALLGSCCKSPAPQGVEDQACYPNDTCNAGLSCIAGRCVSEGVDCGNGICDADETALSCPVDCADVACGNNVLEGDADEACDGSDLGGASCVSLGYLGGTLACAADCSALDESGCSSCGDLVIQIPEVCDGTNLGGLTCLDVGFLSGQLACSADCMSHDTSGCAMTCVGVSCEGCTNSPCAQAACDTELAACSANADCVALAQCLLGCSDINCQTVCNQTFPLGVNDYMAAHACIVCDPDVCYDECDGATVCP